jgi:hypothetical protein
MLSEGQFTEDTYSEDDDDVTSFDHRDLEINIKPAHSPVEDKEDIVANEAVRDSSSNSLRSANLLHHSLLSKMQLMNDDESSDHDGEASGSDAHSAYLQQQSLLTRLRELVIAEPDPMEEIEDQIVDKVSIESQGDDFEFGKLSSYYQLIIYLLQTRS